jgi:hypothetical protein
MLVFPTVEDELKRGLGETHSDVVLRLAKG